MSLRGEVSITLCGKSLSLAPTYRAIEGIELRLGVGVPHLLGRALSGDVRIRDLAVIVHEGLKGAGHTGANGKGEAFSIEEIGEDVLARFGEITLVVGVFLGNALGGSSEKKAPAPVQDQAENP